MQKMKIKKLRDTAIIPTKAHLADAGYDLYADLENEESVNGGKYMKDKDELMIFPHETVMVGTGVAIALPTNTFGAIFARSGLANKQYLRPGNCVGVVDEPYRGEVKVGLHNDSDHIRVIKNHDRIAQLVIIPYINVEMDEVDELDETDRGDGGFGSSGR